MKILRPFEVSLRDIPLAAKLTRVLIVMSTVAGVLAIFLLTSWQVHEVNMQEQEKLRALMDVVAIQESSTLIFDNKLAAQEALHTLLEAIPAIQEVAIVRQNGDIFARYIRTTPASNIEIFFQFTLATPIQKDGRRLGILFIHAHPVSMVKKIAMQAFGGMMIIILSVAFTVLIFSHIADTIVEPLGRMMTAAAKLGNGELGQRVAVYSKDEAGMLAIAFNEMAANLERTTVSRDYTENIIRSMMGALVVLDPEGIIKGINKATLGLLGYDEHELIGHSYGIIFNEENNDTSQVFRKHGLGELMDKDSVASIATNLVHKDGSDIPILLSGSVMRDNRGKVNGIVCVATDITERKQTEEKVRQSLAEKELLLRELHHRVKNNMQVIISLLALEARNTESESLERSLLECQNRVRAMGLVHERLYCSTDLTNVDLHEYVRNVLKELRVALGTDQRNIQVHMDLDPVSLTIDQAVPCGLLINELITNALKHAFPAGHHGTLTITLRQRDHGLVDIRIADDGIGAIDDFDLKPSKTLGLRLVSSLIRQLQGNIEVNRHHGTCFDISFKKQGL